MIRCQTLRTWWDTTQHQFRAFQIPHIFLILQSDKLISFKTDMTSQDNKDREILRKKQNSKPFTISLVPVNVLYNVDMNTINYSFLKIL